MEQLTLKAKRHSTKRVSYTKMKNRVVRFLGENGPCNKSAIVAGVTGNSLRIQRTVNNMLLRGEIIATDAGLQLAKNSKVSRAPKKAEVKDFTGGVLFDDHMGKLLVVGALSAIGIWLALVLIAVMTIWG